MSLSERPPYIYAEGGISACVIYDATEVTSELISRTNSHIHSYCEVYVNVSGDVSFVVEGKVYPIGYGDVIITKPNEFHHCVFHSERPHEHYCLWLGMSEQYKELLSCIFDRENGEGNLISMKKVDKDALIGHLEVMYRCRKEGREGSAESLSALFALLALLDANRHRTVSSAELPASFMEIVHYIDTSFDGDCSVEKLTRLFFVSRSTVVRQFRKYMNTTPSSYVETRRLAEAKRMLERGESVQHTCERCGFSDYSHFIALFRHRFGITPYRYSRQSK